VLVCIGCTDPVLFNVEPLDDFPNSQIVLEMNS
jgi:hypothetical protein